MRRSGYAALPCGPPLAVKKIDRPTFPLSYSLGAENVMTQGVPFTGKLTITVRLDQDGNAGTQGPRFPGDPEREAEAIRSKEGIPLIKPVVDDLLDISKKTGIPFAVR